MSEHASSPSLEVPLNRRRFIASSAASAGALVVGFQFGGTTLAHGAARGAFTPNAYVRVSTDGYVTIVVSLIEMGRARSPRFRC
jgi:isoquinoline 1-oxidoreductase beta subunit